MKHSFIYVLVPMSIQKEVNNYNMATKVVYVSNAVNRTKYSSVFYRTVCMISFPLVEP